MNSIDKKNMFLDLVVHPSDKAALKALRAIPGFSMVMKKFMSIGIEKMQYGDNMASNIRLSPTQFPEIYNRLPPICAKLGLEVPEFYIKMDPYPNAFTSGDTRVFITLHSALLEYTQGEELDSVIAHECGHILCHHVLYNMLASSIVAIGTQLGFLETVLMPIQIALYYWSRMSELSCDRVAALIAGPDVFLKQEARFAGGPRWLTDQVNFEEWAMQAEEYEKIRQDGVWNKALRMFSVMEQDHPYSAVRVNEIMKWCKTEDYLKAMELLNTGLDINPALEGSTICHSCGAIIESGWNFCQSCGSKIEK